MEACTESITGLSEERIPAKPCILQCNFTPVVEPSQTQRVHLDRQTVATPWTSEEDHNDTFGLVTGTIRPLDRDASRTDRRVMRAVTASSCSRRCYFLYHVCIATIRWQNLPYLVHTSGMLDMEPVLPSPSGPTPLPETSPKTWKRENIFSDIVTMLSHLPSSFDGRAVAAPCVVYWCDQSTTAVDGVNIHFQLLWIQPWNALDGCFCNRTVGASHETVLASMIHL